MKNNSFCEELLSENDFEAVLAHFCCYDYGANVSEAVQKISTKTLELYANFIATPMKKTYLAVYYLLAGDTARFLFFFLTLTKMSKEHRFIL